MLVMHTMTFNHRATNLGYWIYNGNLGRDHIEKIDSTIGSNNRCTNYDMHEFVIMSDDKNGARDNNLVHGSHDDIQASLCLQFVSFVHITRQKCCSSGEPITRL